MIGSYKERDTGEVQALFLPRGENAEVAMEMANWCGGKVIDTGEGVYQVRVPTFAYALTCEPGQYLVRYKAHGTFVVLSEEEFLRTYSRVTEFKAPGPNIITSGSFSTGTGGLMLGDDSISTGPLR